MQSSITCANGPERAPASRPAERTTTAGLEFEHERWSHGDRQVAGVDEAGRGPWAGPVVAAACVFDPSAAAELAAGPLQGLTDSKQLTPARRERFFDRLIRHPAVRWCVARVDAAEIDRWRIHHATHRAMAQTLERLAPDFALVDGRPVAGLPCSSRAIVRGDAISLSIAAASILAKVSRDRIMCREADPAFPVYGFARHKGYGTAEHQRALARHGPCPIHRLSFAPVARCLGERRHGGAP